MGDFAPDDGYKNMICVEAGAVGGWVKVEGGETWEGGQIMTSNQVGNEKQKLRAVQIMSFSNVMGGLEKQATPATAWRNFRSTIYSWRRKAWD